MINWYVHAFAAGNVDVLHAHVSVPKRAWLLCYYCVLALIALLRHCSTLPIPASLADKLDAHVSLCL